MAMELCTYGRIAGGELCTYVGIGIIFWFPVIELLFVNGETGTRIWFNAGEELCTYGRIGSEFFLSLTYWV